MPREIEEHHVTNVAKHLADEPRTIRTLAKRMRCSYQAAKRRLEAWAQLTGTTLVVTYVREGERGSPSKAFRKSA